MISLQRVNNNNKDFLQLVSLLDEDLQVRYGEAQKQYHSFNVIEAEALIIVAYLDLIPVGCGCYKKYDKDTAEIKRVYVKPEFRGNGIATAILSELEKLASEDHFKYCILETGRKQHESISLYGKSGYNLIENYGPYFDNQNSICMSKRLK